MMKPTESFVELSNVSIFVQRQNEFPGRPTIIFLHDSLGCVQLWRDFPERLCSEVQCNMLVYDRQGYGKSDPLPTHHRTNGYMENEADVLRDLVIKLDVRNVILFGHSDGGSIALIAAGKYPSEFEAVVVEAAHVFVEEVTLTGIRAALYDYETTDLKSRLEKYHGNKTDTLFKAWTETWLSDNFRSWNIEHFLTNIKCPVLFIQGEEDEYGSAQQVHAVEQQVSGRAEAYLVPQIHHTPHKEAADIVIEKSVSFLLPLL